MVPRLETGSPIKGNGQKPCNMPPSLQGNYLAKTSRERFDGTALLQFKVMILAVVYFAQSWYCFWISSKKIARHMIISQSFRLSWLGFYMILPYSTVLYHVLPYFTIFYHVLPYFTIFYYVLPYFTICYHMLPYFTIFYHMLPYTKLR